MADAEAAFATRVAAERDAHGLSGLVAQEDLWDVAQDHSGPWTPTPRVHSARLAEQVRNRQVVGEKVAAGRIVDGLHELLMASPADGG